MMAEETKSGPGRPEFQPTDDMRTRVERYVYGGMAETEIARAISCSVPTLNKHFTEELENGRARKKAWVLDKLFEAGEKNNVSALKHLDQKGSEGAIAEFEMRPERPAKLGKKEQQVAAAAQAGQGSEWGDDLRPPPKLN